MSQLRSEHPRLAKEKRRGDDEQPAPKSCGRLSACLLLPEPLQRQSLELPQ